MALTCKNGSRECLGCGKCISLPLCSSCQVAIGRGQEYYEGTFGVICAACSEWLSAEDGSVCGLCEESIFPGEEIIFLGGISVCGECARRCIR